MTLREYLLDREQQLLSEIEALHEQIRALQADLVPKEGELAEIRAAKGAIEIAKPTGGMEIGAPGVGIGGFGGGKGPGFAVDSMAEIGSLADVMLRPYQLVAPYSAPSPYAHLTMKQLIEKALSEHFHNGAPTRALLEFFQNAWNRKIERTNLSPQLSRLYQEGVVGRIPSTKGWFLIQPERRVQGFRPYLYEGRIVWSQPETVSNSDQYEPLLTRDIEAGGRRPYRTLEKSIYGDVLLEAGTLVYLLPNEVAPYHVPAEWPDPGIPDDEED